MPDPGSNPILGSSLQGLGYIVGLVVFIIAQRFSRQPLPTGQPRIILLASAVIGGMLGAKLSQWLALGWPFGSDPLAILNPAAGGRTVLGGIICGWIAVEIAKRRLGISYSTGMPFALALPAGEAVGRIGCWFIGCCGGQTCSLPWAVLHDGNAVHPSQLYMSGGLLILFTALLLLRPLLAREGDLFLCYFAGYGLLRFIVEFSRSQDALLLGLSLAQWICLLFIAGGCYGLFARNSFRRDNLSDQPLNEVAREHADGQPG